LPHKMTKKLMVWFGTRPEVIKLAPVIIALRERGDQFDTVICSTGQHREMLIQALDTFGLKPDIDLDVMRPGQKLSELTASLMARVGEAITAARPDRVIVQGDTTTAFVAALAAYHAQVPVAHVEAGLRSHDRNNPFPEEINRRLISAIADIHFTPTSGAAAALTSENIPQASIHVTGNTSVDALMMVKKRLDMPDGSALVSAPIRALAESAQPLVLVTCHRRESFGEDMAAICRALRRIAMAHPHHRIVFPMHLNPNVRAHAVPILADSSNISLLEPIDYPEIVYLLSHTVLALSDSGGLQEETPSFGVPILVLRRKTERPEGVDAGVAELIGADEETIVSRAGALLAQSSVPGRFGFANPYGDGRAAERIVDILSRTP
jgi:UDP-N-acetylglucosamine 2-epimerase (non-hydrolysing)